MTSERWTAADIPDLSGRTAIVTGAARGLGLATAKGLAGAGAHVVLAVRNTEKGEEAAAGIHGSTEVCRLDLADLASVQEFVTNWSGPIDVLVNNAGIMAVPKAKTADGFESQIGTNHLGHFALTNLLLPHITRRVVSVASEAHRMGSVDLDDLNWERRRYERWRAYGQSKLANLLFVLELQRRLTAADSKVRAVAAHPGYAATDLQSHTGNPVYGALMQVSNRFIAQDAEHGALPSLYAAVEDVSGMSYIGPGSWGGMRGYPKQASRSRAALDKDKAKGLWDLSTKLTGVEMPTLTP